MGLLGNPVDEHFDVLNADGTLSGRVKLRKEVHRDGDWHRAAHVWLYDQSTHRLLLQRRAASKDSWPDLWDISSAGHVTAGHQSPATARRETEEELGLSFPQEAFEFLFSDTSCDVINNGTFINNEFVDVFLVTVQQPIPLEAFRLQEAEVSAVQWVAVEQLLQRYRDGDPTYVPLALGGEYKRLFEVLQRRAQRPPAAAGVGNLALPGAADMPFLLWDAEAIKVLPPEQR